MGLTVNIKKNRSSGFIFLHQSPVGVVFIGVRGILEVSGSSYIYKIIVSDALMLSLTLLFLSLQLGGNFSTYQSIGESNE